MSVQVQQRYTLEEYLELERTSEERWEYINGKVFCVSGVTPNHDAIEGNLNLALQIALLERGCRIFLANMRIKVPAAPPYRYADLSVLCDQPRFETMGSVEALTNPAVIVEVLAPATEGYDRGDKFTWYKSIASLREYLLVAQHRPHLTHYFRREGGQWGYEEVNELASSISLSSIDCALELNDVYRDVEFDLPV